MNRPRRAVIGIIVAIAAIGAATVIVQPQAVDVCVQNWEDSNGTGDTMTVCNTAANLKVPNLATHTEGLHAGCNRGITQSSTWSDCITSVRVTALPAAQRVRWYQDTNYGTWVFCIDANGSTGPVNVGSANDVISSFRVEGGNCA